MAANQEEALATISSARTLVQYAKSMIGASRSEIADDIREVTGFDPTPESPVFPLRERLSESGEPRMPIVLEDIMQRKENLMDYLEQERYKEPERRRNVFTFLNIHHKYFPLNEKGMRKEIARWVGSILNLSVPLKLKYIQLEYKGYLGSMYIRKRYWCSFSTKSKYICKRLHAITNLSLEGTRGGSITLHRWNERCFQNETTMYMELRNDMRPVEIFWKGFTEKCAIDLHKKHGYEWPKFQEKLFEDMNFIHCFRHSLKLESTTPCYYRFKTEDNERSYIERLMQVIRNEHGPHDEILYDLVREKDVLTAAVRARFNAL